MLRIDPVSFCLLTLTFYKGLVAALPIPYFITTILFI